MKNFYNCTKKEQVERWENVLRVLQALTPHQRKKHWDMSMIGEKTECGTVACAAGHSSLDPWFIRRGYVGRYKKDIRTGKIKLVTTNEPSFFGDEGADNIFLQLRNSFGRPGDSQSQGTHQNT